MKKMIALIAILAIMISLIGCKADYNYKQSDNGQTAFNIMQKTFTR